MRKSFVRVCLRIAHAIAKFHNVGNEPHFWNQIMYEFSRKLIIYSELYEC